MSRSADGDGMRTLVRKSCGSSEEEDEDGGGRDGPWSATDEDFARCPRRRSTRGSSQNSQRRAIDRRAQRSTMEHTQVPEESVEGIQV